MSAQVSPRPGQQPLRSRISGVGRGLAIGVVVLVVLVGLFQAFAGSPQGAVGGLSGEVISRSLAEVIPPTLGVVIISLTLMVVTYAIAHYLLRSRNALAYGLLAPSAAGLLLLVVWPFAYDVAIAFSNMGPSRLLPGTYDFSFQNGLTNFIRVFDGRLLQTGDSTFGVLFVRTLVWTVVNVVVTTLLGLGLALLLNRPLAGKAIYRTLLIVPWAIPQVIAAMAWRNEFDPQYGFVNLLLQNLGLASPNWRTDPTWALVSVIIVNIWLGIPFMMIIILGGLQSISAEYYEAADMDGATGWHKFAGVTLPLLRPVLAPAITLSVIWTFNQLNVIFLVTEGGPSERTNILVSALYYAAFNFSRFGFAAAFSLVIFAILFVFSVIWMRVSGGLRSVYE